MQTVYKKEQIRNNFCFIKTNQIILLAKKKKPLMINLTFCDLKRSE